MLDRAKLAKHLPVHLPFALVVIVALISFQRVATQHWRGGAALLGGALLLAAALRVLIPNEYAGLLAIRSRVVDVLLYTGLGLLIVAVAVTIGAGPLTG